MERQFHQGVAFLNNSKKGDNYEEEYCYYHT